MMRRVCGMMRMRIERSRIRVNRLNSKITTIFHFYIIKNGKIYQSKNKLDFLLKL